MSFYDFALYPNSSNNLLKINIILNIIYMVLYVLLLVPYHFDLCTIIKWFAMWITNYIHIFHISFNT
ncbi:hypothetical protein KUTeg_004349 [Tegillarca granosa]|uniref:Uncharacterized protein n=1 Tax=Tegillarca granosa TaxID=220873 RepID=A0ABQ9FU75_TEGGR|nr:hypothetical protein KUTeg_004349 [Tegillarca granosa]